MATLRWVVKAVVLFLLVALSGCGTVDIITDKPHAIGYALAPAVEAQEGRRALIRNNEAALEWYRGNEWQFNKSDKKEPPQQCIALSGGGIRSAAFSIGVLKGLQEKGVLTSTDVISSVSGGGYALAWYYMKHLEAYEKGPGHGQGPPDKPDVFTKESIEDLASRAGFITVGHQALGILGDTLFIPANLLLNGVFGTHTNTTPARRLYQGQIEETFMPGRRGVYLRELVCKKSHGGVQADKKECIRSVVQDYGLPYPIVNTTARIDDDLNRHNSYLARTVFEFTPLRFGNDGFDYVRTDEDSIRPLTMAGAIAVSGAAADSSALPGSVHQIAFSTLNQDLGYYIDNYRRKEPYKWLKLAPFPVYLWLQGYHRDIKGNDIYLSDGGHSENLGAFSLVRRLCRHITIVDAEYDPDYVFAAYFKLKSALRRDMQVELKVPDIERKPFNKAKPVAKGAIRFFPLKDGEPDGTLEISYVKLSIDDSKFADCVGGPGGAPHCPTATKYYTESVVTHYWDECRGGKRSCSFPQRTTIDQSYDREQFLAYVYLGYKIIVNSY